ncbi:MAG TPA: SRPBCC family protein [Mycobacterium sp.]
MDEPEQIVSASRAISASAERIFELIAEPSSQPSWDGNDNLASSAPGQRVRQVGDIFKTTLTNGAVRENHVVEFIEGSKIAWRPADPGKQPPGHLWRWELQPINSTLTTVTHTYDWSALTDRVRLEKARSTTPEMLRESMDKLAMLAQASG